MHIMHIYTWLNNANKNLTTRLLISFIRVAGTKLLNKTRFEVCVEKFAHFLRKINSAARPFPR